VAQAVTDQPNCPAGQDRLWSELYRQVGRGGGLPTTNEIESEVRGLARSNEQAEALVAAYSTVAHEIRFLGREDALVRLAEMEIGDRTTPEKAARQDAVEGAMARALGASVSALGACPNPAPPAGTTPPVVTPPAGGSPDPVALFESWRNRVPATLYGAYKTMSVGYQTCNAVALSPLSSSTATVSGITVTGTHVSGTGLTREVTDAAAVYRTNPFYSGRVSPAVGCFSPPSTPLIYDYGGKPDTTSGPSPSIDLFHNAGSGTSALGVDCSGFVTTAVLSGGLRLKQNVTSKAPQSGGVNAAMYADPAGNGLSCFARLASTKTQELRSGDIVANGGHVIMIADTGADPFGIAGARTAADCAAASSSNFHFTIIQSSPSKGGIGMNRYLAADYLAGSTSMRTGLEAYARSFCRVRLGLDSPTTLTDTAHAVVVRSRGGAACTDARVPLAGESCLRTCAAN
jgi:hypothetical protein